MEWKEPFDQEFETTNITDYEAGDILELTNRSDGERFVAIVVNPRWVSNEDRLAIYDLETDCIYADLDNYKVIRKREGFLQLTD